MTATNFLSRLTARALGRVPLIQPRIASRFAPGPAIAPDAEGEARSEVMRPQVLLDRPAVIARPRSDDRSDVSHAPPPSVVARVPGGASAGAADELIVEVDGLAPMPRAEAGDEARARVPGHAISPHDARERELATGPVRDSHFHDGGFGVVEAPDAARANAPVEAPRRAVAAALVRAGDRAEPSSTVGPPRRDGRAIEPDHLARRGASPERSRQDDSAVIERVSSPVPTLSRPSPEKATPARPTVSDVVPVRSAGPVERPAEAIVHVTIGRIEVKAVSSPPPARRKREAVAPSLTLEEYLERRRGAGR